MSGRNAKLVRRLRAAIDPTATLPQLEKTLKRNWYRANARKRRTLRIHMNRAAGITPEWLKAILGGGGVREFLKGTTQ